MGASLAATVVLLRAPAFAVQVANIDECDFALFGRMVHAGAVPYLGVADIKPPLTYVAYHAAELLAGGPSFVAIRLLGIACVLATALLLRAAARTWTGDERAGWAAAWLSVVAISCESPSVSAEILMNVPVAAAVLLLVHGERSRRARWDLACGVAIGIASLVKHQAGIALVAFGLALLTRMRRSHFDRLSANGSARPEALEGRAAALRVGLLALGFALPWLAAAAITAVAYDWSSFWYWVVTRNLHQVSVARTRSAAPAVEAFTVCLAATALPWVLAVRRALRPRDGVATALALLAALTWIPVSIGGRFYEHYFLQFAPPLAVLGAPELASLVARWPALGRVRRATIAVLAVGPLVASVGYATFRVARHDFPSQDPKVIEIARWLRAHTAPADRVFLWGDYSVVYCAADRLPGTRYMRTAPHVGDFDPAQLPAGKPPPAYRSERDIAQTLADLEANAPAVVVDTSPADLHGWSRFPLARAEELERWVRERYDLVGRPAGAAIYLRRPTPTAARGSGSL